MSKEDSNKIVIAQVSAKRTVLTSFLVSVLDVGFNLLATILSGSVVMLAQVLQGAADLAAAGLLLIGIERAKKPSDKTHPFGHGKELYFWSMLSALVMFAVTATFSFYFGWQRFWNPRPLDNLFLAYFVLTVGIITNGYSFSLSFRRLVRDKNPKKIWHIFFNSPLVETKNTFVLDLMGTLAATLGLISLLLFRLTGNLRFDGLGAMLIGLVLGALAFLLLKDLKDLLVGKGASTEEAEKIRAATLTIPQVENILDLKTLYLGPDQLLVNLEVHLKDGLDTDEIEGLMDKIKAKVQREVPTIHHIQVELETPE